MIFLSIKKNALPGSGVLETESADPAKSLMPLMAPLPPPLADKLQPLLMADKLEVLVSDEVLWTYEYKVTAIKFLHTILKNFKQAADQTVLIWRAGSLNQWVLPLPMPLSVRPIKRRSLKEKWHWWGSLAAVNYYCHRAEAQIIPPLFLIFV